MMYLICCAATQTQEVIQALAQEHIMSMPIPLMEVVLNLEQLAWLEENINQYEYVIFSSPTAIEFSHKAIAVATRPTFLTVGKASAEKLSLLTKQNIVYPEKLAGGMALFKQKLQNLNLANNEILIVKGNLGNNQIGLQLKQNGIKWSMVEIYQMSAIKHELGYLKKILISGGWQGIIITSNLLVDGLFALANKDDCLKMLQALPFITFHPQIAKQLVMLGAKKVLMTKEASRKSMVELIRNLHE